MLGIYNQWRDRPQGTKTPLDGFLNDSKNNGIKKLHLLYQKKGTLY